MDSRDSSHSRERSAEKTEKTHKGSKKQKYVMPLPVTLDSGVKSQLLTPDYFLLVMVVFHLSLQSLNMEPLLA